RRHSKAGPALSWWPATTRPSGDPWNSTGSWSWEAIRHGDRGGSVQALQDVVDQRPGVGYLVAGGELHDDGLTALAFHREPGSEQTGGNFLLAGRGTVGILGVRIGRQALHRSIDLIPTELTKWVRPGFGESAGPSPVFARLGEL